MRRALLPTAVLLTACSSSKAPPQAAPAPAASTAKAAAPTASSAAPAPPVVSHGASGKGPGGAVRYGTVLAWVSPPRASLYFVDGDVTCPKFRPSEAPLMLHVIPQLQPDGSTIAAVDEAQVKGAAAAVKGGVTMSADGAKYAATGLAVTVGTDAIVTLDGPIDPLVCGGELPVSIPARPQPDAAFTVSGKTMLLAGARVIERAGGAWELAVSTGPLDCKGVGPGIALFIAFEKEGRVRSELNGDVLWARETTSVSGAGKGKAPPPPFDKVKLGKAAKSGGVGVSIDVELTMGKYPVKVSGILDAVSCKE